MGKTPFTLNILWTIKWVHVFLKALLKISIRCLLCYIPFMGSPPSWTWGMAPHFKKCVVSMYVCLYIQFSKTPLFSAPFSRDLRIYKKQKKSSIKDQRLSLIHI